MFLLASFHAVDMSVCVSVHSTMEQLLIRNWCSMLWICYSKTKKLTIFGWHRTWTWTLRASVRDMYLPSRCLYLTRQPPGEKCWITTEQTPWG